LWEKVLSSSQFSAGLHLLRDCAGALTDLAEASNSCAVAPVEAGAPSPGGKEGSAASAHPKAKEKKPEDTREEKGKDEKPEGEVKEAHPEEDEDCYSEEETEEEDKTKDPVVEGKDPPRATYKELRGHKFQKGNLSKPLGLTPLGVKLSPPTPHTVAELRREDGDIHRSLPDTGREKEREALPRRVSSAPADSRRPRTPERGTRHREPRRERSPSRREEKKRKKKDKHGKNKGKKKRERGREFQQRRLAEESKQWRQKRRHD